MDLPAEPSEEDFRLGLRSGIVLCIVINKINPGAVPKVVEGPSCDTDGATLSAFQYFENVRNFLVVVEELGILAFEASDLEQGGKFASVRIVNCVLALKSFNEWKQAGGSGEWKQADGSGSWKFVGNLKPRTCRRPFMRKNSNPFMSSFTRTSSFSGEDANEAIVESLLSKVMAEFQHRRTSQTEQKCEAMQEKFMGQFQKMQSQCQKWAKKCEMLEQGNKSLSKDKQELQEKYSEKSRQKRKLDEMYDELWSEYESSKRNAIQHATNFYSRNDTYLFSNQANIMDHREPVRLGRDTTSEEATSSRCR